jgi:tyrosine-protein phosphatase SIW14
MRLGVIAVLLLLGSLGEARPHTAPATEFSGVHRFHQVNEHIYRGALPTPEGLQRLARLGIATVLDLRSPDERSGREARQVTALGMQYVNVPMSGLRIPTQEQVEQALQVVEDPKRWPVFVHCRYGVDRTGTVIACYRIEAESWSNERARLEADAMGMHRMEYGMKRFILHFQPAER